MIYQPHHHLFEGCSFNAGIRFFSASTLRINVPLVAINIWLNRCETVNRNTVVRIDQELHGTKFVRRQMVILTRDSGFRTTPQTSLVDIRVIVRASKDGPGSKGKSPETVFDPVMNHSGQKTHIFQLSQIFSTVGVYVCDESYKTKCGSCMTKIHAQNRRAVRDCTSEGW